MATFSNNLVAKSGKNGTNKYICEVCDYVCFKKYNWDKHLMTLKHIEATKCNESTTEKWQKHTDFCCENCGKEYADRTGLWRHKNNGKCEKKEQLTENNDSQKSEIAAMKELMSYIMKENSEMKNLILELAKKDTYNNSITTHTNSHNKAFNLNFFLNETCKEAMNIGEFVDSLKIQLSDLEKVGEAGYIEGISSIIVKNLKELDVTKRPVHCTDKKRETIYIKDNDKWEKDEDKTHMHKLIKKVAFKNTKLFAKFKEEHPDCMKYHSKHNDQYHKIVYESMGGKGDNDFEKNEKIIKNVLKEVVVDKNI